MQWLPTYLVVTLGANKESISLTAVPYVVNSLFGVCKLRYRPRELFCYNNLVCTFSFWASRRRLNFAQLERAVCAASHDDNRPDRTGDISSRLRRSQQFALRRAVRVHFDGALFFQLGGPSQQSRRRRAEPRRQYIRHLEHSGDYSRHSVRTTHSRTGHSVARTMASGICSRGGHEFCRRRHLCQPKFRQPGYLNRRLLLFIYYTCWLMFSNSYLF